MDSFDIVVNIFIDGTRQPANSSFFFSLMLKGDVSKGEESSEFVPRQSGEDNVRLNQ